MTTPTNLDPSIRTAIDQEIAELDMIIDAVTVAISITTDPIERQGTASVVVAHCAAMMMKEHGQTMSNALLVLAAGMARRLVEADHA